MSNQRRITIFVMKREGKRVGEIAKILGIAQSTVSRTLNPIPHRKNKLFRAVKERRRLGMRLYTCGICGKKGHTAQRHKNYSEEDFRAIQERTG